MPAPPDRAPAALTSAHAVWSRGGQDGPQQAKIRPTPHPAAPPLPVCALPVGRHRWGTSTHKKFGLLPAMSCITVPAARLPGVLRRGAAGLLARKAPPPILITIILIIIVPRFAGGPAARVRVRVSSVAGMRHRVRQVSGSAACYNTVCWPLICCAGGQTQWTLQKTNALSHWQDLQELQVISSGS